MFFMDDNDVYIYVCIYIYIYMTYLIYNYIYTYIHKINYIALIELDFHIDVFPKMPFLSQNCVDGILSQLRPSEPIESLSVKYS